MLAGLSRRTSSSSKDSQSLSISAEPSSCVLLFLHGRLVVFTLGCRFRLDWSDSHNR